MNQPKRFYCPLCKQPECYEDNLHWRTCKNCGWEEKHPIDLKEHFPQSEVNDLKEDIKEIITSIRKDLYNSENNLNSIASEVQIFKNTEIEKLKLFESQIREMRQYLYNIDLHII